MSRICMNSGTLWKKQNLYVVSIKEGEEIHTKCRENIFNKIMGKASLSKEREAPLDNQIDKNRNASENIIEKTVHEQKKENILKAAKEKKKSHIKPPGLEQLGLFNISQHMASSLSWGFSNSERPKLPTIYYTQWKYRTYMMVTEKVH